MSIAVTGVWCQETLSVVIKTSCNALIKITIIMNADELASANELADLLSRQNVDDGWGRDRRGFWNREGHIGMVNDANENDDDSDSEESDGPGWLQGLWRNGGVTYLGRVLPPPRFDFATILMTMPR